MSASSNPSYISVANVNDPFIVRNLGSTTDLLRIHAAFPSRYPFLLQSVAHGSETGRWDILFAFPGQTMTLDPQGALTLDGAACSTNEFLGELDAWFARERISESPSDIPFHGGWFVFLAYEFVAQIESRVHLPEILQGAPLAVAVRVPAALLHDHVTGRVLAVVEAERTDLLDALSADFESVSKREWVVPALAGAQVQEDDPNRYLASVDRIQQYIRAGDVFQVNLSRQWSASYSAPVDPVAVFARLRKHNPAPFAALACIGDMAVISSSPERLVRVRSGHVETRPIAGTRPRGQGADDAVLSAELIGNVKERAEHVMLIDLERNDLGRVCKPGSVRVDELMVVESYAHVHHIVSNVCGELREEVTPGQVIRALFPGGTITGCPKVRCMEILAELEGAARGAYTGSLGYLNRDGSMDLNILIRTFTLQGNRCWFRAGGGIVADSEPLKELEETRSKARGLLLALAQNDAH